MKDLKALAIVSELSELKVRPAGTSRCNKNNDLEPFTSKAYDSGMVSSARPDHTANQYPDMPRFAYCIDGQMDEPLPFTITYRSNWHASEVGCEIP